MTALNHEVQVLNAHVAEMAGKVRKIAFLLKNARTTRYVYFDKIVAAADAIWAYPEVAIVRMNGYREQDSVDAALRHSLYYPEYFGPLKSVTNWFGWKSDTEALVRVKVLREEFEHQAMQHTLDMADVDVDKLERQMKELQQQLGGLKQHANVAA